MTVPAQSFNADPPGIQTSRPGDVVSIFRPAKLMSRRSSPERISATQASLLAERETQHELMMQRLQLRSIDSFRVKPNHVLEVTTEEKQEDCERLDVQHVAKRQRRTRKTRGTRCRTCLQSITPRRTVFKVHAVLMAVTYAAQIAYLPLAPTYFPAGTVWTVGLNILLECIFLTDMLLTFSSAYMVNGVMIKNRRRIMWHYLRGWFVVDLISSIPVQLIIYCATGSTVQTNAFLVTVDELARFPRLLHIRFVLNGVLLTRIFRIGKDVMAWVSYSRYSHLMSIARLLGLVVVSTHYIACLWHLSSNDTITGDDSQGAIANYFADLYYAICLIHGQGNSPGTLAQNAFSTVAILVGSVILAIVFGNVAMLVSNFNANETNYQRKMEAVFATMSKMHLPSELRGRIHRYYTHLWEEYESLDGDIVKFSRELTHTLGLEVGLYKYMNLVVDIPFWRDCSRDFVTQIVANLVVRVYLPDDFVIRKGEIGDEMYMINRGVCEVSDVVSPHANVNDADDDDDDDDDDDEKEETACDSNQNQYTHATSRFGSYGRGNDDDEMSPATTDSKMRRVHPRFRPKQDNPNAPIRLYPGHAFGEMSLLMNYKRTANVRAATFVESCVLTRRAFQTQLCRYAEDRPIVLTKMLQNCIEKKEIPFPWHQIRDIATLRRRKSGDLLTEEKSMTAMEAAQALVERLNMDLQDESIKYGFQGFDKSLEEQLPSVKPATSTKTDLDYICERLARIERSQERLLTKLQELQNDALRSRCDVETTKTTVMQPIIASAHSERLQLPPPGVLPPLRPTHGTLSPTAVMACPT